MHNNLRVDYTDTFGMYNRNDVENEFRCANKIKSE